MKNDEMGKTCSTNMGNEKCTQHLAEKSKGSDYSEDEVVVLKWILQKCSLRCELDSTSAG
jgi:hypothetical protein